MKKRFLLFLFIILLFPVAVFAKEYKYGTEINIAEASSGNNMVVLHPGDVIDFTNYSNSHRTYLAINHNEVGEICTTNAPSDCIRKYTVTNNIMFEYADWRNFPSDVLINFINVNDANVYNVYDLKQNHIYKSGDVIFYPDTLMSSFYYETNNSLLFSGIRRCLEVIPQYDDEDVYWQVDFFTDGSYGYNAPHFKVYNYVGPKFSLNCADKSISYGKKTKCYVDVTAINELKEVHFDLNIPNFKISDVSYPNNIDTINGNKEYNLNINSNDDLNTGMKLMYFYLEGTKNENYTDDIKIVNIEYRDEVYEGNYEEVKADLNIVPSIINPKTLTNLLFIIIPIILLLVTLIAINISNKKEKKI